jgi:hypothetical protein
MQRQPDALDAEREAQRSDAACDGPRLLGASPVESISFRGRTVWVKRDDQVGSGLGCSPQLDPPTSVCGIVSLCSTAARCDAVILVATVPPCPSQLMLRPSQARKTFVSAPNMFSYGPAQLDLLGSGVLGNKARKLYYLAARPPDEMPAVCVSHGGPQVRMGRKGDGVGRVGAGEIMLWSRVW